MKSLAPLEAHRIKSMGGDAHNGAFRLIAAPTRAMLHVIVSNGGGWDHVSVSVAGERRCPLWIEMAWIKDQCFAPDETVMQLHPPLATYVNNHPYCLHLWRPQREVIPLPPPLMVGIPGIMPGEIKRMTRSDLEALHTLAAAALKEAS